MDALQIIATRTSPRTIGPEELPEADIAAALEAAVRAPDHGRLRPWRFVLIRGRDRAALGELLADSLRRRMPEASEAELQRERGKADRAPLIIALAARTVPDHPKIPEIEQILAAGAAAQNLVLALHAQGYGAQWKTGPAAYDPAVKTGIGLLAADHLIGFIYAGRPAEPGAARPVAAADYVLPFAAA